jgi:uncharacterized protein
MFISILTSKPDVAALRAATKPAHDEYWSTRSDRLRLAGPMMSDDGFTRLGQILVLDIDDRETAESIVLNDPFVKAGVFASCTTCRFNVSVGQERFLSP